MLQLKKEQYKKPPINFGNIKNIRVNLGHEQLERRKKRRTLEFEENRKNISPCSVQLHNDKTKVKLSHWKAERAKKKRIQDLQKKPPFVVGVIHYDLCPPILRENVVTNRKKKPVAQEHKCNIKKGITKATEKRLLVKKKAEAEPKTPIAKKKSPTNDKFNKKNESFAPPNHKFHPPAGLPELSLFKGATLEDNPSNKNNIVAYDKSKETTDQKLVCCNSNSTEVNMLKVSSEHDTLHFSQNNKTDSAENSLTNSKEKKNLDVSMEEKKYSVEYFKRMLDEEKNRLQKVCKDWMEIQSRNNITEDIRYTINQAVGQTTMLIKEKFKQFECLILDCKRKDSDVLVTCMDLHGFWDMMYLEIKDCNSRFAKLEKLRASRWQEDHYSFFSKSTSSQKRIGTKKKVMSPKQRSRGALTLSDKKEMVEMQANKESRQVRKIDDKCATPCMTCKKTVNVFKNFNKPHNDKFLEVPMNCHVYTSTPLPVLLNIPKRFSTPLITMKVSQLYNKSTMLSNNTTLYTTTPARTTTTSSTCSTVKLETPRRENYYLTATKLFGEKLEMAQTSGISSKEINKELDSIEHPHTKSNTDSGTDGTDQTVIERSIGAKKRPVISPSHSTSSIKLQQEGTSMSMHKNRNDTQKRKIPINSIDIDEINAD